MDVATFMYNLSQITKEEIESEALIEEILDFKKEIKNNVLNEIHAYKGEDKYREVLAYFTSVMLPVSLYLLLLWSSRAIEYLSSYFNRKKTDVEEIINNLFRKDSKTRETPVFSRITKRHVGLFILFVLMIVWTFKMHMTKLTKENLQFYENRRNELVNLELRLKNHIKIWDFDIIPTITEFERDRNSELMKDCRKIMESIPLGISYNTLMIDKHIVFACSIVYFLTAIICFFKLENQTYGFHIFIKVSILLALCYLIVDLYISFFAESMRILFHIKSNFLEKNFLQNVPEIMTYLWLE